MAQPLKPQWDFSGNRKEILIGFTAAGFVAVLVPPSFWSKIFLSDLANTLPAWLIALENAVIAPFVAAATFIGSMGNIPLATVLNANGVLFARIMGFIYPDLIVPPLVQANAKYYGWKMALYIAATMFVSIVVTALILNGFSHSRKLSPRAARAISELTQFKADLSPCIALFENVQGRFMPFAKNRYPFLFSKRTIPTQREQQKGQFQKVRTCVYHLR